MNTNLSFLLIPLVLVCFALSPVARAVTPFPDGGYPGNNTAEGGYSTLFLNTTGSNNTAIGFNTLYYNTTANDNTATGAFALQGNLVGSRNTATGSYALASFTTGSDNTANGYQALHGTNTEDGNTGSRNTATGSYALASFTTGSDNTANGYQTLFSNTIGNQNTATGWRALFSNTVGIANTAIGFGALSSNTGGGNTALGIGAGGNLTTGGNNIDIGNQGVAGESDTIRIGTQGTQKATFIAGIIGAPMIVGPTVHISGTGQLGIGPPSSARFKDAIKPMDKASEAILALKPVSFHYKKELDPEGIPQFGLIAEQVEKVNPALVARDDQGKVYTVRYEAVNAMLLNEFLKAHRTVQEQQREISALRSELKEQRALIQKVNDKVELNRRAPQMAINNQ
jgi:hypothetical protein